MVSSIENETTQHRMKYVVMCGCTLSGIGKGTTLSSIGITLASSDYCITAIKIDPYLNTDAGLISPIEHGEVFVLDDGGEVDLDLGNYERAMRITLTRNHNITSGKIFKEVIDRERQGYYLGKTVQLIPHVTDLIKEKITQTAKIPVNSVKKVPDICLIEIGGNVGDIESGIFYEAIRGLFASLPPEDSCLILLTYIPEVGSDKEQKTKPAQHGMKDLKSLGLNPDFIICRSKEPLNDSAKKKIALYSNLKESNIISCYDVTSLHEIPLLIMQQDLNKKILEKLFNVKTIKYKFSNWLQLNIRCKYELKAKSPTLNVVICGKYTSLSDAYLSIIRSLKDASNIYRYNLSIDWIESEDLEYENSPVPEYQQKYKIAMQKLTSCQGIVVPGGFGNRGVEGMIKAAQYARTNNIPYLGICLGFQVMVIEIARNVLGLSDANSTEFMTDTKNPVIIFMPDYESPNMGGTQRLGDHITFIKDKNSKAFQFYQSHEIHERHRHRFEVNKDYIELIEKNSNLRFTGKDLKGERMEIAELREHKFMMGTQFHPELKTNYFYPSPTFKAFMDTLVENQNQPSLVFPFIDELNNDNEYKNFQEYNEVFQEEYKLKCDDAIKHYLNQGIHLESPNFSDANNNKSDEKKIEDFINSLGDKRETVIVKLVEILENKNPNDLLKMIVQLKELKNKNVDSAGIDLVEKKLGEQDLIHNNYNEKELVDALLYTKDQSTLLKLVNGLVGELKSLKTEISDLKKK